MLEDVANENVLALEIDRRQDLRQQLARCTNEWSPGLILCRAGGLAHAHEVRVGVPFTGHRICRRGVERAARARRDVRGDLVGRIEKRHRSAEQLDTWRSNG